jgi:transcriptional regulator with XRE-family HTH domain
MYKKEWAMKNNSVVEHGYFATILNAGMQQLDINLRELGIQLGISHEHAWKLQTGESLPSRLLVEKAAQVVGISVEKLELAVERDRLTKKTSKGKNSSAVRPVPHPRSLRRSHPKESKRGARV